jgi:hypothetical protein
VRLSFGGGMLRDRDELDAKIREQPAIGSG